jgi:hypothetical protein
MKKILLNHGKFALVDDADFEMLNRYKWHAQPHRNTHYAVSGSFRINGKQVLIKMHRIVLGFNRGDGNQSDHINGDGLDNQRANLRKTTNQENQRNNRLRCDSTSKLKGVHWDKKSNKWRGHIFDGSKKLHLGFFSTDIETAKAYDAAATKYFGRFAKLNFPKSDVR